MAGFNRSRYLRRGRARKSVFTQFLSRACWELSKEDVEKAKAFRASTPATKDLNKRRNVDLMHLRDQS